MLIRFNVKNYLSFSEKEDGKSEELSMIAGEVKGKKDHMYDDGKIKVLKFSAIYGANASGKSNLVRALEFMKQLVLFGLQRDYVDKYCRTNEENKNKESYFEIVILLNGRYFAYGFEILLNQNKFISEWLFELMVDNKEKLIFSRDIINKTYEFGEEVQVKGLIEKLCIYADDIKEDNYILLLSLLNQNKRTLYQQYKSASIFQEVYMWIESSLDIKYFNRPILGYSYITKSKNIGKAFKILSMFGTGITGYKKMRISIKELLKLIPREIQKNMKETLERQFFDLRKDNKISDYKIIIRTSCDFFVITVDREKNLICNTIKFLHNKKGILFDLSDESDGTIKILDLLETLLAEGGKTYVIDELDKCLHPNLTYEFVNTFLKLSGKKNIQLIVITNESSLLDFNLLRRDEVWFIDKKKSGESNIYSLNEFNTRFDQKVDKAYLEGRYGGVPIFNTVNEIKYL